MGRLVDAALVGTGRVSDKFASSGTPTAALVADLPDLTPARRLLLAAGTQAIYAQAGQPIGPPIQPGEHAPRDHFPACSTGAAYLLDSLFTRDEGGILPEALARLQRAGLRLPHRLIVAALETGKRQTELRPLLGPALDRRGHWLAAQNPDWSWVAGANIATTGGLPDDAETLWQEGAPPQRLAILERLRVHDPAQARDWVAESWKSEKAEFRSQALAILATGLSRDDEPFLEAALDDRSKAVRSAAAQLLVQQRDSALSARMRERADALLTYTPHKRGLFRTLTQAITSDATRGDLSVILPGETGKDWQRDGVELKPRPGLGERAWWLICVLAAVPPGHWTSRFTATPDELIAAAIPQEWGQVAIEGWSWAAVAAQDTIWALPLWRYWLGIHQRQQQGRVPLTALLQGLLAIMPKEQIAQVGSDLLDDATRSENPLWVELAPLLPTPWPVAWGQQYLEISRGRLKGPRQQQFDPWVSTFGIAARALPAETFPQVEREWQGPNHDTWVTHEWRRRIAMLTETVALRQRLIKEIPV